jgi:hypothetical protein
MEPTFQRIFGDKSAMRLWFANLNLYSAALAVAGLGAVELRVASVGSSNRGRHCAR